MKEVVITSAVRTAIGNFLGALSPFSATELGGRVIEEAVKRSKLEKKDVDEVIMGNVLPFGLGQNPARQAMIKAGLPMSGGAITVNKVCGSGLKAHHGKQGLWFWTKGGDASCPGHHGWRCRGDCRRWNGEYEPSPLLFRKCSDRVPALGW